MIKFGIKYEGKNTFESLKRDFEKHLSKEVIYKKTAAAINETLKRSVPIVHKQIRKKYTVKLEAIKIDKGTRIKYANPKLGRGGLWGSVSIKGNSIDISHFKHKVRKGKGRRQGGVNLEVIKGRNIYMKHLFRATVKYNEDGEEQTKTALFGRGRYIKGRGFVHKKFLTSTGKTAITKMRGPSPYAMLMNKDVESQISQYINKNYPARLQALLQMEVNKIGR